MSLDDTLLDRWRAAFDRLRAASPGERPGLLASQALDEVEPEHAALIRGRDYDPSECDEVPLSFLARLDQPRITRRQLALLGVLAPHESDTPEVAAVRARWKAATLGPWRVVEVPLGVTELGEASGIKPRSRCLIFTAWNDGQAKTLLPVVGEASGPYHMPTTHAHVCARDVEAIAHAPEDVGILLDELGRAVRETATRRGQVLDAMAETGRVQARCSAIERRLAEECDENNGLRAIIEGRTTPPTEAEIMAHDEREGAWLHADASGIYADTTGDDVRSCVVETVPQGPARRWIALDRDGRPCAWPVPEAVEPPPPVGHRIETDRGELAVALAQVHATARWCYGGVFTSPMIRAAWREILHATEALAWLAEVEMSAGRPVSMAADDARAAAECARLLGTVYISGERGRLVESILKLADAAVQVLRAKETFNG